MIAGCSQEKRVEPVAIKNRWLGFATIAIAPAINLSGDSKFDPDRFADVMASELSYVDGVSVVPVSRALAGMAGSGAVQIESPAHAAQLAGQLGADAILVFAVTEYDPFTPPRIGVTAQLYAATDPRGDRAQGLNSEGDPALRPRMLAQMQRVYDASHEEVASDIRRFAAARNANGSPWGWRRYVVNQQEYMRFCCFATIRSILDGQRGWSAANDNS